MRAPDGVELRLTHRSALLSTAMEADWQLDEQLEPTEGGRDVTAELSDAAASPLRRDLLLEQLSASRARFGINTCALGCVACAGTAPQKIHCARKRFLFGRSAFDFLN